MGPLDGLATYRRIELLLDRAASAALGKVGLTWHADRSDGLEAELYALRDRLHLIALDGS
jgi:hypothetical protein